jgi:hypothetical protein
LLKSSHFTSWEVEIRRITVQGQSPQKVRVTPFGTGHGGMHLSSQLCRKYKHEDHGPGQLRHIMKSLFKKIAKAKRPEDVAQLIECLPASARS